MTTDQTPPSPALSPLHVPGWVIEHDAGLIGAGFRVSEHLHHEVTPYQTIDIYRTEAHGNMMVLDDAIMLTDAHEFTYHEMLVHVPLMVHPDPRRVVVIGGGDGGAVRAVLKHPGVTQVTLCEIDHRVTEVSRDYFPELTAWIDKDPRAELVFDDGVKYIRENRGCFDVILIDSTDPVGPAQGLFTAGFYATVRDALAKGGIMACQGESYWYYPALVQEQVASIGRVFPHQGYYHSQIPCYPGTVWGFAIASLAGHAFDQPRDPSRFAAIEPFCRYYRPQIHQAAFVLPAFAHAMIRDART